MIIIYATSSIFADKIKENGWINSNNNSGKSKLGTLFILSAVPILRVFVFIVFFIMTIYTKEQFDEFTKKETDKDEQI